MQVILLERVRNLGHLGELVNVKPGYARNYLYPYGKALPATANNKAEFEAKRAELEKAAAEILAAAQKRAAALKDVVLVIQRKASEEGKLFGSVSVNDIADALVAMDVAVERRELNLPEGPARTVGDFKVEAHLHSDIIVELKLTVEAE